MVKKKNYIYVIQKHAASHLHYDLRLEIKGVLKSWAIPKEPSNDSKIKRLAVEVEDHEIGYEDFQGIIPEGSYGAGKVEIWDKGTFQPLEVDSNKMIIEINGNKLKGRYCLLRFKSNNPKGKNWLFFKVKDEKSSKL